MSSYLFPLAVGLVPSLVWAWFFIREDEARPEPKRLLIYAFLAGIGATFFVIGPQLILQKFIAGAGLAQYGFWSLLVLCAVEEIFKFLAIYLTVARRKEFDEPLDAMIYMIIAALGFAAVENIASVARGVAPSMQGSGALEVLSLRFIGATLLHCLSSALVGYYWGLAMLKKGNFTALILEGLGVAIVLHAVFNYFIILFGPDAPLATLFLISASFFIFNDFDDLKRQEGILK